MMLSTVSTFDHRSVSAQMHELGHNLNLAHAGEGSDPYGDQSGMMG